MPGYSGNRRNQNFSDTKRRWNAGGPIRDRRNDGRSIQDRMSLHGGGGISPWESGVAPGGSTASLLGDFQSSIQNQYIINRALDQTGSSYGIPNKIRRLDGIENFGDHRSRGLLPSPNASALLGVTSQNFQQTSRSSNLQQRLGNTWSSGNSGPRRTESNYYPSDSQRGTDMRRRSKQQPNRRTPAPRTNRDSRPRHRYQNRNPSKETDKDNTSAKDSDAAKIPLKDESDLKDKNEIEEDKKETTDSKENETKEEKKDDFPVEALYCHVCDLEPFTTKKGYIRHLEGITHSRMAEKFHGKHAALLEYLSASAKFAEMKRKDKLIRSNGCKGLPLGRIVEKVVLRNYLDLGACCDKKFKSPFELHEHRLSVHHLKRMFEKGIDDKVTAKSLDTANADEIDEMIKSAKEKVIEEPLSVANIPVYDATIPFGMQYIEKRVQYRCEICRGYTFTNFEEHCQSYKHYKNIVSTLNKEEEKKMKDLIKEEAEAKDEKQEQRTQKYERHSNDEDRESNFSDKNEEDHKYFMGYDDYMKDDEMIILDEEKNDEMIAFDYDEKTDGLSEEPQTILDDAMNDEVEDEPMVEEEEEEEEQMIEQGEEEEEEEEHIEDVDEALIEDDVAAVGEDLDDEVQILERPNIEEKKGSKKGVLPRRSSRIRQ